MKKAVFLDRDGIINEDGHYIYKIEEFRFKDGIFDFCRAAKQKGYLLIVCTNQSGIARGYYSDEDFLRLTDWMCSCFHDQSAEIDHVYYCPYHPEKGIGKYRIDSYDRKPNPGMFFKAQKTYDIDLEQSIVLGDRNSDVDAGRNAGVGTLLLMPGEYGYTTAPDVHLVHTFSDAAVFLK